MKNLICIISLLFSLNAFSKQGDIENHIFGFFNLSGVSDLDLTDDTTKAASIVSAEFPSPSIGFGYEYLYEFKEFKIAKKDRKTFFSGAVMYEFSRSVDATETKTGTAATVRDSSPTSETQVISLLGNVHLQINDKIRAFTGLSYNIVSIDKDLVADWKLKNTLGYQFGASYTASNIRGQILYRKIKADLSAIGKGTSAGSNFSGSYDFSNVSISIGYLL